MAVHEFDMGLAVSRRLPKPAFQDVDGHRLWKEDEVWLLALVGYEIYKSLSYRLNRSVRVHLGGDPRPILLCARNGKSRSTAGVEPQPGPQESV